MKEEVAKRGSCIAADDGPGLEAWRGIVCRQRIAHLAMTLSNLHTTNTLSAQLYIHHYFHTRITRSAIPVL